MWAYLAKGEEIIQSCHCIYRDDGTVIENTGNADCIVFSSSPEGEQRFELGMGENATLTDISQPI
jgi:hypothetical protein